MKVKNYESFKQLLVLVKFIESKFLKAVVTGLINSLLRDEDLNNKFIMSLFKYEVIKDEYYLIKDILILIEESFNINKYADILNVVRLNNNLGYDRNYLDKLLNDLNKKALKHDLFKNSRFEGLFNLLKDENLLYNNVGLRILILRLLLDIDIKKLNVFTLSNNRLNDKYKHLVYKNDKVKFYSKLYLIEDNIILSTLEHDNIINIAYTLHDNINIFYGGKNDIIKSEDNITTNDIKKATYTYYDNESLTIDKVNFILLVLFNKGLLDEKLTINSFSNPYVVSEVLNIFNNNIDFINKHEVLFYRYEDILRYFKEQDIFKSNNIDLKNDVFSNDYIISGNNFYTAVIRKNDYIPNTTDFNYKYYINL